MAENRLIYTNFSRKLAQSSLLVALALSTNYLLISVPNVKLMDSIVFVSSYQMGLAWGVLAALLIWLVYGTINPLGANLLTLLVVASGELLYVFAARIARSFTVANPLLLGLLGGVSTFVYDLYTNALTGTLFLGSLWLGIMTMNFPLPMGIIHEVSNIVFFSTAVPILIKLMSRR
jgi:hypothetical protein